MENKELKLKNSFKESDFYKKGVVFLNKKVEKNYINVKSFSDLGVKKRNILYTLSSGIGKVSGIFDFELEQEMDKLGQKDVKSKDIPLHILQYALSSNPFFYFNSLEKYFPNLKSSTEFITNDSFLGDLSITFSGTTKPRNNITNIDYLQASKQLLATIESELKDNIVVYEGTEKFYPQLINQTFKDKILRISKSDERINGQEELVQNKDWFAYNANYGTPEEKEFVKLFARKLEQLNQKYDKIYLIRNKREVKIYDEKGQAFEPDFILFTHQKDRKSVV